VLGAAIFRIPLAHVLPNFVRPDNRVFDMTIPSSSSTNPSSAYLGLGIQPPNAAWVPSNASGTEQINSIRIYWWLIVFPAASWPSPSSPQLLGDALRDAGTPLGELSV